MVVLSQLLTVRRAEIAIRSDFATQGDELLPRLMDCNMGSRQYTLPQRRVEECCSTRAMIYTTSFLRDKRCSVSLLSCPSNFSGWKTHSHLMKQHPIETWNRGKVRHEGVIVSACRQRFFEKPLLASKNAASSRVTPGRDNCILRDHCLPIR